MTAKPTGPIPPAYDSLAGELAIGGRTATDLVAEAGSTPLFVYSRALIERRVARLRAAIPPRVAISYAVKANPFGPVLQAMKPIVDGFDIASAGELAIVRAAGIDLSSVSFAGPGKRDEELEAAIAAGVTLNCESEGEAQRTLAIARRLGTAPRMAVRANPGFELKGSGMKMGGGPKPFGIDAERVVPLIRHIRAEGAVWEGLHIFAGSQALSAPAIIEAQDRTLTLAEDIAAQIDAALPRLNLGGGFGVPYFPGDEPLDVEAVGAALEDRVAALPRSFDETQLSLELGRYLVGEAGVYLCRIIDRKISHGTTYLVTDGGLHHQLAASGNFGTVVRRNYPVAIANRLEARPDEIVNIVGCLCTPLDRLADQVLLPAAQVGDIVAVFCAGAYGATASPSAFLGHGPAAEILV